MSKKHPQIPRNLLRQSERQLRLKLNKLIKNEEGLLRATLSERQRVCGKSNCKCATGEKHRSLYMVQRTGGRMHQLFVPAAWAEEVRQWVSNYQVMQQLLDELSDKHWDKVRKREI